MLRYVRRKYALAGVRAAASQPRNGSCCTRPACLLSREMPRYGMPAAVARWRLWLRLRARSPCSASRVNRHVTYLRSASGSVTRVNSVREPGEAFTPRFVSPPTRHQRYTRQCRQPRRQAAERSGCRHARAGRRGAVQNRSVMPHGEGSRGVERRFIK